MRNYFIFFHPVCIPDGPKGFWFLYPAEVIYVKSAGNYCDIYCVNGIKYLNVSVTMQEMRFLLPRKLFCRVHNRYMVSLLHLRTMNRTKTKLYCAGDIHVSISDSYRHATLRLFKLAKATIRKRRKVRHS